MAESRGNEDEVTARATAAVACGGFPAAGEWKKTDPAVFCWDWQGKNEDPERQTEVRVLWSPETLFLRFACRYRELVTFVDAEEDGYRDQLWDADVAEVFLQSDRFGSRYYKEFEVAPNGHWVDLDIFPGGRRRLRSGLRRTVQLDEHARVWTAQLAIPLKSISDAFDLEHRWRVNFYRCEGTDPKRWYSAWRPTHTEQPSFHVPASFGSLRFV